VFEYSAGPAYDGDFDRQGRIFGDGRALPEVVHDLGKTRFWVG